MVEDSYLHKGLRKKLIKQLREKGITNDRVLDAIELIPRHVFLDNAFLEHAYQDKAFPIGEGQTISQPYTVAVQSDLLELKPGMKVLEIGTGCGYQCSVLIALGAKVYTIEYHESLHKKAKKILAEMGMYPTMKYGDGSEGWLEHATYDRIIATAGAPYVPQSLIDQLNVGGILIIPVGDKNTQKMLRIRKTSATSVSQETFGDFRFVPLVGKDGWTPKLK
ncbi:MAG: protein-L-isoaspartate(D-aspartate) O-methyltransferase [Cytophagaceae bacterium]